MLIRFPPDIPCDALYLQVLKDNPKCHVLNYGSPGYEPFIKIHHASCTTINGEKFSHHTGHGYTKVCADTTKELKAWCIANKVAQPTECQKCFK